MKTATASYPYTVDQVGDEFIFTYKKSKLGYKTVLAALWPSLILSCFLAYWKVTSSYSFLGVAGMLPLWLCFIVIYTLAISIGFVIISNLLRRPGTFKVNAQGIILGETLYAYKDIAGIYIKKPGGGISESMYTSPTGFTAEGGDRVQQIGFGAAAAAGTAASTVASAAANLSYASRKAFEQSIKERRYKICFRFGKREKVLVSHVNNTTAELIMQKLQSIH